MSKIISAFVLQPGQTHYELGSLLNGVLANTNEVIRVYSEGGRALAVLEDKPESGYFIASYDGRDFKVKMTNLDDGIYIEVGDDEKIKGVISYNELPRSNTHDLIALKVKSLCAKLDKIGDYNGY